MPVDCKSNKNKGPLQAQLDARVPECALDLRGGKSSSEFIKTLKIAHDVMAPRFLSCMQAESVDEAEEARERGEKPFTDDRVLGSPGGQALCGLRLDIGL